MPPITDRPSGAETRRERAPFVSALPAAVALSRVKFIAVAFYHDYTAVATVTASISITLLRALRLDEALLSFKALRSLSTCPHVVVVVVVVGLSVFFIYLFI